MSNNDPEIGKSVMAAGLKTNYLEAGEGEPVVLIHGSGPGVTAYANWRLVIPVLAQKYRVLAPDIAGFGYTERKADTGYNLDFWVRHLVEWLDAVGGEKGALHRQLVWRGLDAGHCVAPSRAGGPFHSDGCGRRGVRAHAGARRGMGIRAINRQHAQGGHVLCV